MFKDKTLICVDCGQEFTFTASEQEFYAEKGFTNEPKRCRSCRSARKRNSDGGGRTRNREMFAATCAACGAETQVPFKPTAGRPVYCSDCFRSHRD